MATSAKKTTTPRSAAKTVAVKSEKPVKIKASSSEKAKVSKEKPKKSAAAASVEATTPSEVVSEAAPVIAASVPPISEPKKEVVPPVEAAVPPTPASSAPAAASIPAASDATAVKTAKPDDRILHLKPPIIVKDLAARMSVKPFQLISDLMQLKILVSVNQPVEPDVARKLCEKHGYKLELERRGEHPVKTIETPKEKPKVVQVAPKAENLVSRAPVVTIMGHVDHGKTSLLDAIRKANVVSGEAGGITQHIGAYSVALPPNEKNPTPRTITFLDTPGHEAFTAMRSRGANVTDIVILVVAASEGIMPQTLEALNHARAAGVPIIVALTKMDLEAAQKMKDRVKKELQEHDLASEDWGGKTITVEVSATKKTGIDQLLEMIMLQAEVMELKAERDCPAEGSVIEAQMEAGRGATATVLVRKGVLRLGDAILIAPHWGKVKGLVDDKGKMVKEAGPSTPVKVVGLTGVPQAGITFQVMESEPVARAAADAEQAKQRSQKLEGPKRLTLEDLLTASSDNRKILKIILKTDVQGSCEAIMQSLTKLPHDKINVDVIHVAVGPITESDILLAKASKALIVGFQVKVDTAAAEAAKREDVQIQLFRIIYELVDKVREFMAGLLDPEIKLTSVGLAEVKQTFAISKGGMVAGCLVSQGRIERKGRVRVLRRKNVIFEGGISALRRFQDDVSDVRTGLECGIRLENFNDFQPGDQIEVYHLEKVTQKL
jgi:translation initiation factor IF-2